MLNFLPPKTRHHSITLLKSLADAKIIDFDAKDNLYKNNFKLPKAKTSKLALSLLYNPTSLVHGEESVLKDLQNHELNQIQILNPHKWNISRKKYLQRKSAPLKKRLFKK